MTNKKRRTTQSGREPKLSTEKYRRLLLARAYSLILAPDWSQVMQKQVNQQSTNGPASKTPDSTCTDRSQPQSS